MKSRQKNLASTNHDHSSFRYLLPTRKRLTTQRIPAFRLTTLPIRIVSADEIGRVLRDVQEKERRGPDNADATQSIQIPDSALRSSQ